jgi:flagellar basal-body rod protein FlgB
MLNPIAGRVEQYMDLVAARQKVTASNIANVDTPGYKTKDIDFSSALNDAAGAGSANLTSRATPVENLPGRPDGNTVSLDREARNLAENALRFHIAGQLVQNQIRLTRTAMLEIR